MSVLYCIHEYLLSHASVVICTYNVNNMISEFNAVFLVKYCLINVIIYSLIILSEKVIYPNLLSYMYNGHEMRYEVLI